MTCGSTAVVWNKPVGRAKLGDLAKRESNSQGGKTGGTKNRTCPKAGPRILMPYAARFAFAAGFGSGCAAFLAFSFAANSCLTLRVTASASTP